MHTYIQCRYVYVDNISYDLVLVCMCVCMCVCVCVQVSGVLSELHVKVRERVRRACEDTLAQQGFVPDPIEDPAEDMDGEPEPSTCMYVGVFFSC